MAERTGIGGRLKFSEVPKTTALFRDFLYHHHQVADLYPIDPRRVLEQFDPDSILSNRDFSRRTLRHILENQNRGWDCSPRTLANIELLEHPESLVVVTGQQVGLFTGPLLTLYKALSVIRLAGQLGERFGHRFVPLFWMAADDHDHQEVDHAVLLDRANVPVTLRHQGDHLPGQAAGAVRVGPQIEALLDQIDGFLPDSEFKAQVMELFSSAYAPTASFAEAFARAMLSLCAEDGLVLLDPTDAGLRRLCQDVFQKELAEAPRPATLVAARGDELARRGYHAQLHPAPSGVNLFLLVDGRRTALIRDDGGFRLKGSEKHLSQREIEDILDRSPERFSPNAALRPLVQDCLFPVAAYLAGPAEVAYFAQLGPLYELFGVPRPPVYPRMSLTLIEDSVRGFFDKYALTWEDVFVEGDRLFGRLTEAQLPGGLEEDIDSASATVREAFGTLSGRISAVEPTMEGYLKAVTGKVDHQLQAVRRKLLQARRARDKTLRAQVWKVSNHLYPEGHLQERLLNAIPFLARHGLGLVHRLRTLDAEPWEHWMVHL